jgi:hypothetical protein
VVDDSVHLGSYGLVMLDDVVKDRMRMGKHTELLFWELPVKPATY